MPKHINEYHNIDKDYKYSIPEIILGLGITTYEILKGIYHFLPHVLETRPSQSIIINKKMESEFYIALINTTPIHEIERQMGLWDK